MNDWQASGEWEGEAPNYVIDNRRAIQRERDERRKWRRARRRMWRQVRRMLRR